MVLDTASKVDLVDIVVENIAFAKTKNRLAAGKEIKFDSAKEMAAKTNSR